MPKKAFDFSKTEMYKIIHCDPEKDFCYVGHTTNFTERKKCHKRAYTYESAKGHHCKVYQMIRENGGWDNFKMVFIEKWPCESLREAEAREQYWIDTLKPNMNHFMAQRSQKQYRIDNKEHLSACDKVYREENKEYIAEYYKHWREDKKEYLAEKNKAWRNENKEYIAERKSKRFECECGSKILWCEKARHFRTQKHIQWCEVNHEM